MQRIVRKIVVKYSFLILFLAQTIFCLGQNLQLIDDLKHKLPSSEGVNRFTVLNELAWEYRFSYPDSTIYYANAAFSLGNNLKLTKELAQPLNFIGVAYNYKGDRLKAYDYYDKALKMATNQTDSVQIAYSNNNLGRLFFEQGLLSRSYDYFIQALALFEAIDDASGLAYTYQSLANLYKSQRDFKKAETNYLKAYKIRLSLRNTRDIMSALVQLSRLYQDHNEHEKALSYLHLADSAGRVINDEINLAEIKTLIAESYLYQGKLNEAEAMCMDGLNVITRVNNVRILSQAYITLGQIKFKKRDFVQARKAFITSLDISTRISDLNSKMESHYWLWKLSEKENNQADILRNHNLYLLLKDSVKDLDLARQVERYQFEVEIERKEKENERLKANEVQSSATIQHQKLQNIILVVVIVFVSLLGLVQWRSSRKRNEINEQLAKQFAYIENQRKEITTQNEKLAKRNEELSQLNHEKDTIMSIVAHDLKSPLNRIKGMGDIMELEGSLTADQKMYLSMIKEATRSGLDLIKDLLDVHMLEENVRPNYTSFDLSQFVLDKTKAFGPIAESKQIHLNIARVENEQIHLDADYLNRIVDNLLSNAIKFSKRESIVDISAGKQNGHIWISVKDQGPGFSELDKDQLFKKFKKLSARPTAGETSNGLGLAIVKTLVDRLNGSIELISEPRKGSQFIVKFPVN